MEDKTKSTTTIINSDIDVAVDRLSSLPEHLISDILSKLPIDNAVATSILSRHWRHQWTYITRFHLTCFDIPNCDELFYILTTVDTILRKLNSPPNNLRTFYLHLVPSYRNDFPDDNASELCCKFLPHWFQLICSSHTERFKVYELRGYLEVGIQNAALVSTMSDSICSRRIEQNTVSLPECIFQNKTLVELVLHTNLSRKLPHYVHLPNLKKLSLRIYEFDRQLLRAFFKSLPLLEHLDISASWYGHDHFIDISAPNLKIFLINVSGRDSQTTVLINAPKLTRISISIGDGGLVLFRFVKIPIHLLGTTLLHRGSVIDDRVIAIQEILKAVRCTRSLSICCPILNVFNSYNVDKLPTFHNLVDLILSLSDVEDMNLAIPACLLEKVKTIHVINRKGYSKKMSLMENILSKANVLERLVCIFIPKETQMDSLQKERDFIKALFMLPRVSSSCEIEFNGLSGRSLTNVVEDGSLT